MSSSYFLRFCILVLLLVRQHVRGNTSNRYKTVYQKIQEEPEYSSFSALVRNNRGARLNLHYEPLSVFVPENKAFDQYEGEMYADLAFYHMSFEVKTIQLLQTTNVLSSVNLDNPPLWITKVNEDIYINNAKIIQDRSNYVSHSEHVSHQQQQVLHMIDSVLDPMIKSPQYSPNAYDFLVSSSKWNIGLSKTITKFYERVQDNQLLNLFKKREPHTFFIPIDSGVDLHKYKMIDKKIILRHVVPNHVLFTRPSENNVVTMTDEDEFPYALSFEKNGDRLFVKCTYFIDSDFGEFSSEILVSDIPVKNGVVHLISQPLGNFNKTLKPFPYLPVLEKITNDPEIDVFYKMGSMTKFNKKFERQDVNFTYFVPRDSAWLKLSNLGLEPVDNFKNILARHLVVSASPYSMQRLASMTRINNYTDIQLNTEGGPLRFSVIRIEGTYFINWNRNYIEVVRPDYECTNGVVHIINGPLVNFREKEEVSGSQKDGVSLSNYWDIVKDIIKDG